MSKNLQVLDQVHFKKICNDWIIGNENFLISKKNTTMGFRWCCDPIVVIFFETKFFSFSKKIASVGWSSRCNFFWNAVDPTLVIFLTLFEKITTTGSSLFISTNGQGYCKFFWNALDPTLVIFLTFFEKNYNDWIKCKLSKSKFKWTGLVFCTPSVSSSMDLINLFRKDSFQKDWFV